MLRPVSRRPEVYLFIVWSKGRGEQQRIVADLADRFSVLHSAEVVWTVGQVFASSLTRMYGDALPPGSDKERHCGTDPFLAVVVEDRLPRYRLRRTNRGVKLQNSAVFDARRRYREWTGGGHRVHASDSVAETERNLVLLFGRRAADFQDGGAAADVGSRFERDPVGSYGWQSLDQLVLALEAYGGRVVSQPSLTPHLIVATPDVWWGEQIAGGRDAGPGLREVQVAGDRLLVRFVEVPAPPTPVDDVVSWVWSSSERPRRLLRTIQGRRRP